MGWLISLITGPIFGQLTKMYTAKLASQNTYDAQAAKLAAQEIAGEVAARQIEASILRSEQGWWLTAMIRPLLALPFIVWVWKVVVWDKVLSLGSTDALSGQIGDIAMIVIGGYFGGRTIEKVARIFRK